MRTLALLIAMSASAAADELLVITRDGCPPCRALKRDLLAKPEMYAPHSLRLVEGREAMSRHLVDMVPTVIRLRDGREVARRVGYSRPSDITNWLRATD
jgi:hypothetical protein